MKIALIAAMARNRVIGAKNRLPWKIPEDLKRFKKLTTGHCMIMGRKTYDSIGRPLPDRTSIVVTRDKKWKVDGVVVAHSLEDALKAAKSKGESEVFVIGGGEIYGQALEKADRMLLTLVQQDFEGDVFFPKYKKAEFDEVYREDFKDPIPYRYVVLQRKV